ncbi:MAG TPA: hypothetical protein VL947_02995, partial [Cytophagales bacterium]|nr:hypothetical protein [Cytophagales bacterium]
MDTNNTVLAKEEQSTFDVKKILFLVLKYWYLYVIAFVIFWAKAFFDITYSTPEYRVQATLMIKDKSSKSASENLLTYFQVASTHRVLINEIEVIKSKEMIQRTIENLDFQISYFVGGDIKRGEIYPHKNNPYIVSLDTTFQHAYNTPIHIRLINDSTFRIQILKPLPWHKTLLNLSKEGVVYEQICQFEKFCSSPYFRGFISKKESFKTLAKEDADYFFIINDIGSLTYRYAQKLTVTPPNTKGVSFIYLSSTGENPAKEVVFLNKLCDIYSLAGLEEKNEIISKTIKFIDEQLFEITDSLQGAESQIRNFRAKEKMLDVNTLATSSYATLEGLEKEKVMLQLKHKYYVYLKDYLTNKYDIKNLVVPSLMGVEDPLLNKLVTELYSYHSELVALGFSGKSKNPTYEILELKMNNTQKAIEENLINIIANSNIRLNDNAEQIAKVQNIISNLPEKESNFVKMKRKFTLNDNIYNYLLEKRTELSISKAASTTDNKVVSSAENMGKISPNEASIHRKALFLSILIPSILIFMLTYFNNTILSKEDIVKNTSLPILGTLPHFKGPAENPAHDAPKSHFTESLRSLKVNVQYTKPGQDIKVFGITSTISGEGKTFFSISLATSLAMSGAKVVIIGADLRKPRLHKALGI